MFEKQVSSSGDIDQGAESEEDEELDEDEDPNSSRSQRIMPSQEQ